MMQNYDSLVDKISKISNLSKEDIERKVEAKRAKLSGLISKEGAAQIVAAELGISFEKQKYKINELSGARRVNVTGKVIKIFPVHSFKKENREGKVVNFVIADETGNVKVVLWDINHISLIEKNEIKEGDVIEISNASVRNNEIHLTGFSDIKISKEILEDVKTEKEFFERKLRDIKSGENISTRAFVVQSFEPRFFEVCPECKMRARPDADGFICEKHGKVIPLKRALLNIVLDDGTESMRSVLFNEQIERIGFNLDSNFIESKEKLLGRECWFTGSVRENKLFGNPEIFVSDIDDIDLDKLISSLEKQ
jgi:ssDNA-binding replication factor A large subunit